jgi:hypothetical protein
MSSPVPTAPRRLVTLQVTLMAVTLLTLALFPPAQGKMILVPLRTGAEATMIAGAVDQGATLVGAGPLPHSFVVNGTRANIAPAMLARGILVLAAPPAGCGNPQRLPA